MDFSPSSVLFSLMKNSLSEALGNDGILGEIRKEHSLLNRGGENFIKIEKLKSFN